MLSDVIALLDVLAWPLVTALLALSFRSQIARLLERITKIRSGQHEVELGPEI